MSPVNGWHKGELAVQRMMGFDKVVAQSWTWIEPEMEEAQQAFVVTRLPFIPVTTIDDKKRPWSSILAGADGKPGFMTSRHPGELTLNAHVWEGDPFPQNVAMLEGEPALIAAIAIDFSVRRRCKLAGHVETLEKDGQVLRVHTAVDEVLWNCPKYINMREFVSAPDTHPRIVHRQLNMSPDERLPDNVISFIHNSDTLFLGTYYDSGENGTHSSSHIGMNQRGGRPGFARVRPSDGRTLVIPDYSGNRLMSSLGNIEATPLAGVTFVSFATGAVLYLTGDAQNIIGPAAQRLMLRTDALTTVNVTGYILVEDALPVRQKPSTEAQRSPYSPPVRLLAEEVTSTYFSDPLQETPNVTLTRIEIHSDDIATFTFESQTHVDIVPGQAAVLDFKSLVGALPYQHMAPQNPMSVNDDRIRTWTVSGSSRWIGLSNNNTDSGDGKGPLTFTLTMRQKPGGVVTSALFAVIQQMAKFRPDLLENTRLLQLSVPLVGIAGDFTLPRKVDSCASGHEEGSCTCVSTRKWLWVAGGVGVTPFLAMLAALREKRQRGEDGIVDDIVFVLSSREPDVFLPLVFRALEGPGDQLRESERHHTALSIHVFHRSHGSSLQPLPAAAAAHTGFAVKVAQHTVRVTKDTLRALDIKDVQERQVYMCGSESFERGVLSALKEIGVDSNEVRREALTY